MKIINANIDQQIVRDQWKNAEWEDRRDGNANNRLGKFLSNKYRVNLIELSQSDFTEIFLPEHAHKFIRCNSEISLNSLIEKFKLKLPDTTIKDECSDRIGYLTDYFDLISSKNNFLEGKFMFITRNLELSVKSSYKNSGYYTGSFHQFAAYALWLVQNSYKPIRLYLIE